MKIDKVCQWMFIVHIYYVKAALMSRCDSIVNWNRSNATLPHVVVRLSLTVAHRCLSPRFNNICHVYGTHEYYKEICDRMGTHTFRSRNIACVWFIYVFTKKKRRENQEKSRNAIDIACNSDSGVRSTIFIDSVNVHPCQHKRQYKRIQKVNPAYTSKHCTLCTGIRTVCIIYTSYVECRVKQFCPLNESSIWITVIRVHWA